MTEQQIQAIIVRALKTFIQAFLSVFSLGLTSVVGNVVASGQSISGYKSALLGLIVGAVAAGLSALINIYIKPVEAK